MFLCESTTVVTRPEINEMPAVMKDDTPTSKMQKQMVAALICQEIALVRCHEQHTIMTLCMLSADMRKLSRV